MDYTTLYQSVREFLAGFTNAAALPQAFVALDGYVDKIQQVVKAREQEVKYYSTISDFSADTGAAAGKSAQFELVTHTVKLGGNAPILSHALACLGLPNYCVGTFGSPGLHPVFADAHPLASMVSLGPPAETNALEFHDGKLILSDVSAFSAIDWQFLKANPGLEKLKEMLAASHTIALVDWCNVPHATAIWEGLLTEVLPWLPATPRHFLFDLADPSRKLPAEIHRVCDLMPLFMPYGKVTLGLNENEARKLHTVLAGQPSGSMPLQEISAALFERLGLHQLLIHPLDASYLADATGCTTIPGKLVKTPRISTGGGDNLNAGFCFGQALGLSFAQSAVLGMATSGAYVTDGASPDTRRLLQYLADW